jgi:hypothetical protein
MLRVDPKQRARLINIICNLTDRIAEARTDSWLGEVQGLHLSLQAAKKKLAHLDRANRPRHAAADLYGTVPSLTPACGDHHPAARMGPLFGAHYSVSRPDWPRRWRAA